MRIVQSFVKLGRSGQLEGQSTAAMASNIAYSLPKRSNPLAVVIVTFNSADTLPGLLSSLQHGLGDVENCDIVVVDNQSTDYSVEIAEQHPVDARVIRSSRNGGYAAAINMAAETIRSDADLLILNPDIRVFQNTVRDLQRCLGDPTVGIAVPRILEETGELSFSLRRDTTLASIWFEAVLGGRLADRYGLGEVLSEPKLYGTQHDVEWATGAILLVSAEARKRVGDWDESFFLYSEEVDFMRRVRRAGLKVRYHPNALAVHIGGDTHANPVLYSLCTTNRVRDYGRNHGRVATALLRCGMIFGEVLRSWRGREHRAALRALLRTKFAWPDQGQA